MFSLERKGERRPYPEINTNQGAYNKFWLEHSKLGLNSTKYLAHRDLPFILAEHLWQHNVKTKYRVLDFGCGAGQTAKIIHAMFQQQGLQVELYGIDINEKNVAAAQKENPTGTFVLAPKGKMPNGLQDFDLVICNFVLLENSHEDMLGILRNINGLLNDKGIAVITSNTAKTYDHANDWNSFNTKHPENVPTVYDHHKNKLKRQDGQQVKKTVYDKESNVSFTFFDYFYSRQTYKQAYRLTGLRLLAMRKPLGAPQDKIEWKSETHTPPYRIDVVCRNQSKLMVESELRT